MKKINSGFTLIELMISISLLSLIMLLGTWSFSLFTNKWEGHLGDFSTKVAKAKDRILLNDIISSIVPYVYRQKNIAKYYFNGSESEFKGVTLGSIFHPKSTVAFRIQVKTEADGSYYLLYQEAELIALGEPSNINYTHEKVLIEKAANISFSYFAWNSLREKLTGEDPVANNSLLKPEWRKSYDSVSSSLMPIAIRVNWNNSVSETSLVNDQGHWLGMINSLEIGSE